MSGLDNVISDRREDWAEEYKRLFGLPISDMERFFTCVERYGRWNVYEAMVVSSTKKFDKDPLGYILAVAHSKWRDEKMAELEAEKYEMRIRIAIERSLEEKTKLDEKIKKAKRKMLDNGSTGGSI